MGGTREGARKASATNRKLYGEDFYRVIGSKGGKMNYGKLKGFAANRELARIAGAKGGKVSRRKKNG